MAHRSWPLTDGSQIKRRRVLMRMSCGRTPGAVLFLKADETTVTLQIVCAPPCAHTQNSRNHVCIY